MTRLGSAVATAVRLGLGSRVGATGPRPTGELVLYEFEACPFCRKVREALVWLDLDVSMRPCPPGGTRFRPAHGPPYPMLVDGEQVIRESSVIVRHLVSRYGDGQVPWPLRLGPLTTVSSGLASLALPRVRALASEAPARPLELFADETSAEAREIRQWLCAREIAYRWRTCGRGSAKFAELAERTGRAELPALLDGDADLRGAGAAVAHLQRTYGR
ncbi:glutathione S-transferase N-terminal domain-containing protein [Nannocystis punicea]|uniref:Glutathione S-transferase N-terminal domain-containing protein n=1 Tax=Nannocystis punicea TaxID=2995304 RepID=A0ABY7H0Y6_9BACT|nr:glutathione S-transferase N-terminal domain-containing protein [Nannocystis poenicansa]WAS92910.1 glutathione S-transferase N-terminal domain-containing protein [Nannocystis poenicansa]